MIPKQTWTIWILVLVPASALGQLTTARSIGLFGYQTLEPLGFNSSYSSIVDEWGNFPIPAMNLDMSNTSINERNWSPTGSVLKGKYLLTGQLEIENVSARKFEENGRDTDTTHINLLSNTSSLLGARLESSGARESLTWQISGQAGRQRFHALWNELAPWGVPEYEVLGLYACAGYKVSNRLRVSGRVSVNRSASMFNSFDFDARQWLYRADGRKSLIYLIDSIVPFQPVYYNEDGIPFDAVAQIEQLTSLAQKTEYIGVNAIWTLALNSHASRWYQRVSSSVAEVDQPLLIPNGSVLLTRESVISAGVFKWLLGIETSTRSTLLHFDQAPGIPKVTNRIATAGAELLRKSNELESTYSGKIDFTTAYGIRPSGGIHLKYKPNNLTQVRVSVGHDWREPSPFEHQWKSMLNADALHAQSETGQILPLHERFQFERASFAQFQVLSDFGKHHLSRLEIVVPIALIHQQWNVDMKGATPPESPYFNFDAGFGSKGILLSLEPCKLYGVNASVSHLFEGGGTISCEYQRSVTIQQKGGEWKREYLMPTDKMRLSANKTWSSTKSGRRCQSGVYLERSGPVLYTIDLRYSDPGWLFAPHSLRIRERESEPLNAIGFQIAYVLDTFFSLRLTIHHTLIKREIQVAFWDEEHSANNDSRNAFFGISTYDANFSPATAPIVPTEARIQLHFQF